MKEFGELFKSVYRQDGGYQTPSHPSLSKGEYTMRIRWISFIVLPALALTGCAPSQTDVAASSDLTMSSPTRESLSTLIPAQPTQGDNTQMNPFLPTPSASGLEGLIEKAKADLAQRLSIAAGDISLVEAKEVVWPDGSLGCPQPDMMYAQVLTPGYLIKLKYDSRDFEYHAGKDRSLTYCKNPLPAVEGTPDNT